MNRLAALGLSDGDWREVMAVIAEIAGEAGTPLTARQQRNRRYYLKKKDEKKNPPGVLKSVLIEDHQPTEYKGEKENKRLNKRLNVVLKRLKTSGSVLIKIERNSEAGKAWEKHFRATRGKGVPWTDDCWRFPSEFPPSKELV